MSEFYRFNKFDEINLLFFTCNVFIFAVSINNRSIMWFSMYSQGFHLRHFLIIWKWVCLWLHRLNICNRSVLCSISARCTWYTRNSLFNEKAIFFSSSNIETNYFSCLIYVNKIILSWTIFYLTIFFMMIYNVKSILCRLIVITFLIDIGHVWFYFFSRFFFQCIQN